MEHKHFTNTFDERVHLQFLKSSRWRSSDLMLALREAEMYRIIRECIAKELRVFAEEVEKQILLSGGEGAVTEAEIDRIMINAYNASVGRE